MTLPAPPVDARSAADIARQTQALIETYAPAWNEVDPVTGVPVGISAGLIGVFARFAELTLQRLNQAPDKNRLAFLDMLGERLLSAQPARAPVTFTLAAGATAATVPARTQVAVPPGPGAPKPVVFETTEPLNLTPATLDMVVVWDGPADRWAEGNGIASAMNADALTLFRGTTPVIHEWFVGQAALLGYANLQNITLRVTLSVGQAGIADPRELAWDLWDGETSTPLTIHQNESTHYDLTQGLTTSGEITFDPAAGRRIGSVAGVRSRWLRCRLLTPVTTAASAVSGRIRETSLPRIQSVSVSAFGRSDTKLADIAFSNLVPVDVSRDFLPFGDKPAIGSTFYIGSAMLLEAGTRKITVSVGLTSTATTIWYSGAQPNLMLRWEYWDGNFWQGIGTTSAVGAAPSGAIAFDDASRAFTTGGEISFVPPTPFRPVAVNGVVTGWLRVRLQGGGYNPPNGATGAPWLNGVFVAYSSGAGDTDATPDAIVTNDGMRRVRPEDAFVAFQPAEDRGRSLYLGFSLPAAVTAFPQLPVALYADLADVPFGMTPDNAHPAGAAQLAWSCWTDGAWDSLMVADGTDALTTPGPLRFLPPAGMARAALFGGDPLFWVRATWVDGDYKFLPRLRRLLVNTVMAEQAVTIANETMGSGNGQPNQRFALAQTPVLDGVAVVVIEADLPAAEEQARVIAMEGADAIVPRGTGAVWVRWHEVSDFLGSGPRDRHYILDHGTGVVRFGDGINGLVAPRGTGNVIATSYRTGGGSAGNVAAGAIVQMKTTLPYVGGVSNPLAATDGAGTEEIASLLDRAPRAFRHGNRAVTLDDFQDLARAASTEVARSLAVPLLDLTIDPDGTAPEPGRLSVVIVPDNADAQPFPSARLVEIVRDSLAARALPGVEVCVVGPEYLTVAVQAVINVARIDDAAAVKSAALAALRGFLHPLTGGQDGRGWAFGRLPHRSDLLALLQRIDGVDHVRTLTITQSAARDTAAATGRFLVCSGPHRIDLAYVT